jgi:hypothetical protein
VGLHLNFDLELAASTTADDAAEMLRTLHAYAHTLPFASVSPFLSEAGAGTDELRDWLHELRRWASIIATPIEDQHTDHGDVESSVGFLVHPGQGCETAWVGLMRRYSADSRCTRWQWTTLCKTQYASVVSDEHLITCHTSLVALLDTAITLGFTVAVRDETFYWETRDTDRLLSEVHKMNRIVAAFAGRLSDAIGAQHRVVAPIFSHRQFERLEMGDAG